jgi:hypothetical protein
MGTDMRTANSKARQTSVSRDTSKRSRRTATRRTAAKQTEPRDVETSPETVIPKILRARKARFSIPVTHIPRIKTWLKFGLTVAQAASVYGVDEDQMRNTIGAERKTS